MNVLLEKRGEILPKKPVREMAGLLPGDKVCIEAVPGKMVIRKIYSVEELFRRPHLATISVENLDKTLAEESQMQEEMSTKKVNKYIR